MTTKNRLPTTKNLPPKVPAKAHFGTLKREMMLRAIQSDAPSRLTVFRRAFEGRSLRAAVTAKCLECVWLDLKAIRECAATECPLHEVRPFRPRDRGPSESGTPCERTPKESA